MSFNPKKTKKNEKNGYVCLGTHLLEGLPEKRHKWYVGSTNCTIIYSVPDLKLPKLNKQ